LRVLGADAGSGDSVGDAAVRVRCSSLEFPSSSRGCVPEFADLALRRKRVLHAVVALEILSSVSLLVMIRDLLRPSEELTKGRHCYRLANALS